MGEYTLHDGDHLFRVLRLMEKIIPEATLMKLSIPELMLLILTSFFHDIGMAADERDVAIWNSLWDNHDGKDTSSRHYVEFVKYCQSYPSILTDIGKFKKAGNSTTADLLKKHLISEFIRSTHGERARLIIEESWNGKISRNPFALRLGISFYAQVAR